MLTPRNHRLSSGKTKFKVQTSHRALYRAGLGGLVAMLLLGLVLPYIPYISEPFSPVRRVEAADTITVTTTADTSALDGQCSLREAITATNTNTTQNECTHNGTVGLDFIEFNLPGAAPYTITLITALPTIVQSVVVDGQSEPDWVSSPIIILNGDSIGGSTANGLVLGPGSDGSVIQGLVIQGFPNSGIRIDQSNGNTIRGNYVGTNAAGTAADPNFANSDGAGIELFTASNNTIGGTNGLLVGNNCTGDCNLISGNGPVDGSGVVGLKIRDGSENNTVVGNFIGSDVTGTLPVGNGRIGLQIINSDNNIVGGTTIAHRNIISGNNETGLVIISYGGDGGEAVGNVIRNNYIGLNSVGIASIPGSITTWPSDPWNYSDGIRIRNSPSNTITGNYIAGHFGTAIRLQTYGFLVISNNSIPVDNMVVTNNFIGTNGSGTGSIPNGEFGIFLQGASNSLVQGNVVNNNNRGIVVDHEYYPIGPVFVPSLNNRISQNSVANNTNLGIDIVERPVQSVPTFGITANDGNDADGGNNDQQNFPVLTAANLVSGPSLTVSGNLTTIAGSYLVEFFSSPSCDASGNGEGATYLGSTSVVVASTGVAEPFTTIGLPSVALGSVITTTATSNNGGAGGETSEFSGCATVTSALPTVSINDPGSVLEGTGGAPPTITYTVTLSAASGSTVTVPFLVGGSASNGGVDYTVATGSPLSFSPGVTVQNIVVNVNPDALDEDDETVVVTLDPPTGANLDPDPANTIGDATILDDDNPPTVSIDDVAITEGTGGGGPTLTFTVTLSTASGLNIDVPFTASDGTATAADYTVTTGGPLSFAPGDISETINVTITPDALDELDETFNIQLDAPTNATLDPVPANTLGVGTINDDDDPPIVSIDDVSLVEGSSGGTNVMNFTVTLSSASAFTVTAPFTVADGTAVSPADYTVSTGSPLIFNPGTTSLQVQALIVRDNTDESNETFTITLDTPTNATLDADPNAIVGVGTILDDDNAPVVSIDDVAQTEGTGGITTLTYTVSLTNPSSQTVSVSFTSANGTATTPADYSVTTTSPLTFNPGVITQIIAVDIVTDALDENNEDFTVTLTGTSNATLDPDLPDTIGVGTITDDDATPTVSIDDLTVNESAGTLTFTVTLSAVSGLNVSVPFTSADGTATTPADYSVTTGSPINIAAGLTTQTIAVDIVTDALDEPNEDFTVTLQTPTNADLDPVVANTIGVGTINDDDNAPTVSIDDVAVIEGTGGGTTTLTYTVTLSAASGFTVSVPFTAADVSATSPSDYSVTTISPLTFSPGVTTQNILVDIVRDATDEPNETFEVILGSPTNATLDPVVANTIGVGTINNDDGPPLVSINDVTVNEVAGTLTFTVSLSASSGQLITVPFTSADGTATTPADYSVVTTSPLTFTPGDTSETITVNIVNDALDEDDETFTVTLGTPTNAVLDPTPGNEIGTGTITDNDTPPTVSIDDLTVNEAAGTLTFTATLSAVSGRTVTVPFVPANGTATTPADYSVVTISPLTFGAGVTTQTITVNIVNDTLDEDDETFTVTLGTPTNAVLDPTPGNEIGTGTITDNDTPPTVSIDDVTVNEAAGTLTFTATLSAVSGRTVTVPFTSANGTATTPADYSVVTISPLTFNAGVTTQSITVNIVNDTLDENSEDFTVTLQTPTNADLDPVVANTIGVGTITDNDNPPTVSIDDVTVNENAGTLTFTVSLSTASGLTVTAPFTSAGGTAAPIADYAIATISPLTFTSGDTSETITVNIVNDTLDEANEDFTVTLQTPTNATLDLVVANTIGVGTINDDDAPPTVSIDDVTVNENAGTLTFTVTLSAMSGQTITVPFISANGTATSPADFSVATISPLTFNSGVTTQSVTVNIVDDANDEPAEDFTVTLQTPTNATLDPVVANTIGVGTITDNDNPPTVSINDVAVTEGTGAGTTTLTYTVTLSAASAFSITVPFTSADVSATSPGDYSVTTISPLTFNPGVTTQNILVDIVRDATDEPNETFEVTLGAPTNATLDPVVANTIGVGTINNDDGPPLVSINDVTVNENAGTLTFTVSLSAVSGLPVSVPFTSATGTATTPADYAVATVSPLNFVSGDTSETITVNIVNDTLDENNETFTVTLGTPTNAQLDPTPGNEIGTGTINDDDNPPTVSIDDVAVTEGTGAGTTTLTYTVTLSTASGLTVTVPFTSANGTATGADYSVTTVSPLTFNPGVTTQTIAVNIVRDALDENNEDFTVTLGAPTNATLDPVVANTIGVGTINDDDNPPTVSIDDVAVTEGTGAGTTTLTFTATLSTASGLTITVPFTSADGTATVADYSVTTVSPLTFNPGVTTQTIAVNIVRDATDEPNETFTVTLGAPTNATLDPTPANTIGVGTINDDDNAPTVSIDDVAITEGTGGTTTLTFTVTLSAASGLAVTVPFTSANGTATGADYSVTTSSPLNFSVGVTTQTIAVNIVTDNIDEPNETFTVILGAPTNATVDPTPGAGVGIGTINDDDNAPVVSINDVTVTEGTGGTNTLTFTVALSNPSGFTVTVPFTSANGTATAGDYSVTTASPLTFNAGVTSQSISVNIVTDATDENNEDFTVTLGAPTNATLDPTPANTIGVGTINDDDAPPTVSIDDVAVTEGTGVGTTNLTFTVTLSAASDFPITVPFTVVGVTAATPADFTVTTTSPLNFTAGTTTRTIVVSVVRDAIDENNETLDVTLGAPTNATLDPTPANTIGVGTINDDDNVGVTVTITGANTTVVESPAPSAAQRDTFDVRLASQPSANVTITLSVSDGQTLIGHVGGPYGTSLNLTFVPSGTPTAPNTVWDVDQTVEVVAVDDAVVEPAIHNGAINFAVQAGSAAEYVGLSIPSLTVRIQDNDGPEALAIFNPQTGQASLLNTLQDLPAPSAYNTFATGAPIVGQWVMGDWDGDGQKTPGVYGNGVFAYTNTVGPVPPASWIGIWFGLPGPAVPGRFDAGVGHDCIGVIDSGNFPPWGTAYVLYFACNLTSGPTPPLSFQWLSVVLPDNQGFTGTAQFTAGDWDGNGTDSIAVRRSEFIAYTNVPPAPNAPSLPFSLAAFNLAQYIGDPRPLAGDVLAGQYGNMVSGDWDSNGVDSFGLYYPAGYFYYRNDLLWNSGLYTLQRVAQPIGTTTTATSWRAGVSGGSGAAQAQGGEPVETPTPSAPTTRRVSTVIESDDPQVARDGKWSVQSTAAASGNRYVYSGGSTDDTLTLEFVGTSVEVIYVESRMTGTFTIMVDDVAVRTVVTTGDVTEFNSRTLIDYLSDGHHTLQIIPISGTVAVDAFVVTQEITE
ncbi:MAG: right-handed parallel beta-helix repeat-containing protein [Anaerolineae bacterium]|nr:right-handed parallel beta-helix repeat-containing protein [Anaerolineae bacterium]